MVVQLIESLFFIVFGFSGLVTVLTALDKEEIAWPVLAFVAWLICAVGVSNIESSPSVFLYSGGPLMMLFFGGIAVVFIVIFFNRVLDVWQESHRPKDLRG